MIYECGFLRICIKIVEKGAVFIILCTLYDKTVIAKDDCNKCDMKIEVVK